MGSLAELLAQYLGLINIAMSISTACSFGAKAFASARNFIEAGICDAALAGILESKIYLGWSHSQDKSWTPKYRIL